MVLLCHELVGPTVSENNNRAGGGTGMSKKNRLLAILLSVVLVFSGLGGFLPAQLVAADDVQPDLFFSEYIEGTSNNKALEIYNPTNEDISLSSYRIKMYFNGNTSAGLTIQLGGTLSQGGVYVVAPTNANETIKDKADHLEGSNWFNGNDAIVLEKGEMPIDSIGQVGHNPGTKWDVGGVSTLDRTLLRKPHIVQGRTEVYAAFDPSVEWISLPVDTFEYLGDRRFPSYNVTFNSGELGSFDIHYSDPYTSSVTYGESAAEHEPIVVPDPGYEFVGWSADITVITKALEVTAEYQEIPGAVLFFSEYIEGTGNNKAIEIFNYSDHPVSLSGYSIFLHVNGNTNPSNEIKLDAALGGVLNSKAVLVVVHNNADPNLLAIADITSGNLSFNGDDAVILMKDGDIIDSIGQVGVRPSDQWIENGVGTLDMTLLRKPEIVQGRSTADESFDPSIEWIGLPVNTFEYLGNRDFPEYDVTFVTDERGRFTSGGNPDQQTQRVSYGMGANPPTVQEATGYIFDDWDQDYSYIEGELTISAKYKKEIYRVDFDIKADQGTLDYGSTTQYIPFQESALSPQLKPKRGHSLVGWDQNFRKVETTLDVQALYEPWTTPGVFFSEYVEGSGPNNKALEIYNATGKIIDLNAEGYKIEVYPNGQTTSNLTISLEGTIAPKGVFVLAHSDAHSDIAGVQDQENGSSHWFNGDDVVVLRRGHTIVDVIGKLGEVTDPGIDSDKHEQINGWVMGTVQTGNRTLVRKPWVSTGVTDLEPAIFDPSLQWMVFSQGTYSNLGSHNCEVVHLVIFDPMGGEVESGDLIQTVYTGYDALVPDLKVRTGHVFLGWDKPFANVQEDLTVNALWSANQYTFSFDSMGGNEVPPITQDYGTPVHGPEDPVRTGYTFLGWEPALPETMPAEDVTFEAQWELNAYTITFDTGGGSKIAPIIVNYGDTIIPPASPVWPCCSFKGWSPALPATMPAEDLTVKALWEVNVSTIIFDSVGGSFIPPLTQDVGSSISPPTDPVRTGYTFLGWEPALPETMPLEGMELVAQWQINQYRLIFDSDGGSPLAPQVLDYGSEIKAPPNPLRLGYRFVGWDPALPDKMGAADMTVKALWRKEGVVEGEDVDVPDQETDLDGVPSTGERLPMTESLLFSGLAFLLLAWRRRLFAPKETKDKQV